LEEKKEDLKYTKTHFGPEETEDIIKKRQEEKRKRRDFLNNELRRQIEDRTKQREFEKNQELGIDKISIFN